MSNQDIYQRVTDIIIENLEKGVVPWHRPWRKQTGQVSLHTNLVSKKPYRGVNQWLCEVSAMSGGFTSPYWLSFKQVKERGGKVRKGEKGTMIVFWKILRKKTDEINTRTGQPIVKTIPLLKFYYVFNADQCDGLTLPATPEPEAEPEFTAIEQAQAIIDHMPLAPKIFHRGDRAYYSPLSDAITLPEQTAFVNSEAYYGTAFHELVHATGHESRTGRVSDWTTFGSDPYAKEELVAEMGAAMLTAIAGIETTYEQSAAYCASWIRQFEGDVKLVVGAAGQAQRAADWILARDGNGEAEAEKVAELVA